MGRWDFLEGKKPQDLKDYVLDQVADELARDLRAFPPPIEEWLDAGLQARFQRVLGRTTKPELETLRVACELARRELLRDYQLIDLFCRSPEWKRLLPDTGRRMSVPSACAKTISLACVFPKISNHVYLDFRGRAGCPANGKLTRRLM